MHFNTLELSLTDFYLPKGQLIQLIVNHNLGAETFDIEIVRDWEIH